MGRGTARKQTWRGWLTEARPFAAIREANRDESGMLGLGAHGESRRRDKGGGKKTEPGMPIPSCLSESNVESQEKPPPHQPKMAPAALDPAARWTSHTPRTGQVLDNRLALFPGPCPVCWTAHDPGQPRPRLRP